jgi:hypothetical protein
MRKPIALPVDMVSSPSLLAFSFARITASMSSTMQLGPKREIVSYSGPPPSCPSESSTTRPHPMGHMVQKNRFLRRPVSSMRWPDIDPMSISAAPRSQFFTGTSPRSYSAPRTPGVPKRFKASELTGRARATSRADADRPSASWTDRGALETGAATTALSRLEPMTAPRPQRPAILASLPSWATQAIRASRSPATPMHAVLESGYFPS